MWETVDLLLDNNKILKFVFLGVVNIVSISFASGSPAEIRIQHVPKDANSKGDFTFAVNIQI